MVIHFGILCEVKSGSGSEVRLPDLRPKHFYLKVSSKIPYPLTLLKRGERTVHSPRVKNTCSRDKQGSRTAEAAAVYPVR